jgi:hypothetical protein
MKAEQTLKAINSALEASQEREHRKHLGASIIGRSCARSIWYTFRWAKKEKFRGRMLRLFDRGHKEEDRFIDWLRAIGCEVWTRTPDGKQYRVSDCLGHFGGSLDGVARGIPEFPTIPMLTEFKTHNEKSFKQFETKMLVSAKYEHYVQCQLYMGKMQLEKALYMGICKNNDALYLEIIDFHPDVYNQYLARAKFIIFSEVAPPKLNQSPGWWQCQFCNFKDICHNDEVAEKNCRTCCFSTPVEKKKWECSYPEKPVIFRPDNLVIATGCQHHLFLPDMIGNAKLISLDPGKQWIELEDELTGHKYKHGKGYLCSEDLIDKIPF